MKIKQIILTLMIFTGICLSFATVPVSAAAGDKCGEATLQEGESCCGGVVTSILSCDESGGDNLEDTGLWGVLMLIINILTAGIGVLAVGGIVYGSILYTTATDSMEQKKKAKTIIFDVVVGIVVYAFMYSFLNFIVPGGIFN